MEPSDPITITPPGVAGLAEPPAPPPCDVAIIGLAGFYPEAGGLWSYWENILNKVQAVKEIPPSHWDWRPYYDPNPRAPDKIVSKWGGFMGDIWFDPLVFGITPKSIPSIEPLQLLLLEAVRQAIADAGYTDKPFPRERTAAVVGIGGGGAPLSISYGFRACMPLVDSIPNLPVRGADIIENAREMLPEWTEDSFPGILLNIASGRVANRFNLGGPNMAIDAACGSSLAALGACVRELEMGTSDMAIAMGADTVQTPYAYVAFSKTHALSPKGRCRPFDADADGIALAEGIGVAVLKRLKDAERDGDKIYAVIKGVGSSSDGRDKGLTAPGPEGQLRALRRAYAQARLSPAAVGLVEAHGTGTVVGDTTEAQALGQIFREAGADPQSCALGSVKSMIGHSKCAAGLAGLIKAAFALHHKVLPPTLVEKPNTKAGLNNGGPLYLNTEPRPWTHGGGQPRMAGVSAFGFGGTNFHVVLQEHAGGPLNHAQSGLKHWPAEVCVWRRSDKPALLNAVKHCRDMLAQGAKPELPALAASLWQVSQSAPGQPTLAVVASSLDDLKEKLDIVLKELPSANGSWSDPRGLYWSERPTAPGKVAFLFPGQGSQYPNMLAQAAIAFPEVRETLDAAERTLAGQFERPLGKLIYPPSSFAPEEEQAAKQALQRTEVAQPAVGACSLAMFKLLTALGIAPDLLAGHSYGEYVALAAAGALNEADLIALSHRRGQVIQEVAAQSPGGMAAVEASPTEIEPLLTGLADVTVANHNAPKQTVLAGSDAALSAALEQLQAAGIRGQRIPVACGFHSPLVAAAKGPLTQALAEANFGTPCQPVYSNTTAAPYAADGPTIARQLAEHLIAPVQFQAEIEAMYEAGARVFLEVGPQAVLTGLVTQTLAGRSHLALATDQKGRPGLVQLAHVLGQLLAAGVPADLDRLFQGRDLRPFDLAQLAPETGQPKPTPTTWVVNGVRSRPVNAPEPRLLGQPLPPNVKPAAPMPAPSVAPNPMTPRAKMSPSDVHPAPVAKGPESVPFPVGQAVPDIRSQAQPDLRSLPDGAAQVMLRFQDVMARFLETQRSVMLSFLGAVPASGGRQPPESSSAQGAHAPRSATAPAFAANGDVPQVSAPTVRAPEPVPAVSVNGTNGTHHERPSAKAAPLDREELLAKLLDLVSERTGYPKDALSIDLDLEADLGIDSIKRIEILGTLAESLELTNGSSSNLEMEKLSVIKTLRGIADYVSEALGRRDETPSANGTHKVATDRHPAAGILPDGSRRADIQRLVIRLIDAPLPDQPSLTLPTGALLLTDDRQGVAQELADRLAEMGGKVALLRHLAPNETHPKGSLAADLTDPVEVADLLARVRAEFGPVAGLVHLLPLAEPMAGEAPADRARREVKSLYLLARALEEELRRAGSSRGAVLLAATALGGQMGFGDDPLPEPFPVGHGGVAGFVKCLGYEWPEVMVRAVDFDPESAAPELADRLLAELGDPDGPFEVGHADGRRLTWQTEPGPVDQEAPSGIEIGPDSLVLITGGARGVTAKVALELAKRFSPRLVLVGRSPQPTAEPMDTANLSAPTDIKAALMTRFKVDGKPSTPTAVESAYQRLKQDREIRGNLDAIRAAGSEVEYRSLDVRDSAAFRELLDELAAQGLSGVIHGAGVIDDKLVRDKTPESFEKVFATKVDSGLTLAEKLAGRPVQFLVLFSSLAGRYGNRGQADYAAANEVLAKLALGLDRQWPGRVVAMDWGPWGGVGMVADLEKHLIARGLQLISPETGPTFVIEELLYGRKGEAEVVIAGGTERPLKPQRERQTEATVAVE